MLIFGDKTLEKETTVKGTTVQTLKMVLDGQAEHFKLEVVCIFSEQENYARLYFGKMGILLRSRKKGFLARRGLCRTP